MSELIVAGFDYDSVDEHMKGKLKYFADKGHKLFKQTQIQFIAKFGEVLSDARKELADHHGGTFVKWATTEFDMSARTVWNYVNAWDRVLCNNCTTAHNLSATALYLLSEDKTPTAVLPKAIKLSEKQTKVTRADIERLIEANSKADRPKPEQSKPAAKIDYPDPPDSSDADLLEPDDEPIDILLSRVDEARYQSDDTCSQSPRHADPTSATPSKPKSKAEATNDQRLKTVKTVEALMRAFDDLNEMKKSLDDHHEAIEQCKVLLAIAKGWK